MHCGPSTSYPDGVTAQQPVRRFASMAGLGGALGAVAVDVLYVLAIIQQGPEEPGARIPFVVAWIAGCALVAGVGAITQAPGRRALLLGIAAAALLALAVPALWSIGVPLLICALATGFGATRAAAGLRLAWWKGLVIPFLLVVAAAALLLVGFALTGS